MSATDTAAALAEQAGSPGAPAGEPAVLLETLAKHRTLFRRTVDGITEDDARRRTTVSALTLGGLLKHVVEVEDVWVGFVRTGVVRGAENWNRFTPGASVQREDFTLGPDETVAGLLRHWDDVAARTDALVTGGDLDVSHPLPEAPWFPPGGSWTARHALAHVIGEIAQHSGHADILREALDGQRTMG